MHATHEGCLRKEDDVPDVRLERTLRVPADPAAEALGELLKAIADQEGPWRGFALHIGFGDLRLPDVGYVAVPIRLTARQARATTRASSTSRFTRRICPRRFPRFKRQSVSSPRASANRRSFCSGGYDLPMQIFGKFLDTALTPDVAETLAREFHRRDRRRDAGARRPARSRVRALPFLRSQRFDESNRSAAAASSAAGRPE